MTAYLCGGSTSTSVRFNATYLLHHYTIIVILVLHIIVIIIIIIIIIVIIIISGIIIIISIMIIIAIAHDKGLLKRLPPKVRIKHSKPPQNPCQACFNAENETDCNLCSKRGSSSSTLSTTVTAGP
jgi:hypothetical protein